GQPQRVGEQIVGQVIRETVGVHASPAPSAAARELTEKNKSVCGHVEYRETGISREKRRVCTRPGGGLGRREALADRVFGELGDRVEVELLHDVPPVNVDGPLGDL